MPANHAQTRAARSVSGVLNSVKNALAGCGEKFGKKSSGKTLTDGPGPEIIAGQPKNAPKKLPTHSVSRIHFSFANFKFPNATPFLALKTPLAPEKKLKKGPDNGRVRYRTQFCILLYSKIQN